MNKLLTWDEAVESMKADGFSFQVQRVWTYGNDDQIATAWQQGGRGDDVKSSFSDPTSAINDLLRQCRERWPARQSWEDKSLEELFLTALQVGWGVHVDVAQDQTKGRYYASVSGRNNLHEKGWGDSLGAALLAAMKAVGTAAAR